MQEAPSLLGNRANDVWMRVSGGIDRDTRRAVEEHIAIDVLDDRWLAQTGELYKINWDDYNKEEKDDPEKQMILTNQMY